MNSRNSSVSSDPIAGKVEAYYTKKLAEFGPTPRGVDWNSEQSQQMRFQQLSRVMSETAATSVLDYGCGYGALCGFISALEIPLSYTGFDISKPMVAEARHLYPAARFESDRTKVRAADVVVASGIFSVRMDVPDVAWEDYIERTIEDMWSLSERGIAFNMLTAYSDAERMRPDLYYADPLRYFERCRRLSKWVALLHDYGLYEFTLVVRAER